MLTSGRRSLDIVLLALALLLAACTRRVKAF
jgi:hypothetical protein